MAREIKFRAWEHDRQKMCYGYKNYIADAEQNNYPLMQFTGLLDKNGTEIYEGDWVKHDAWDYNFQVIFNQEKARFVCKLKTGLTTYIDNEMVEVSGNIYENPELLTQ